MKNYIKHFNEIDIDDVPVVGGKNASLDEMFQKLTSKGVHVPDGFTRDCPSCVRSSYYSQ
jgi:pyruvate,water dikinase